MKFCFLGTGTSVGVPQIGCSCPVCTSADPHDKRRRCGVYVTVGDTAFLIDTPPELREACIAYGISKVDALVLTHAHMDHVAGFDDVRRFNTINGRRVACDPTTPGANGRNFKIEGKPLPCYALPDTIIQMRHIFPYIGIKGGKHGLFRPQVEFHENTEPFSIGAARVTAFPVEHGFPCCGYLIEAEGARIGYASDCCALPEESYELLKGVDVMVLDCLRERVHATHFNLAGVLAAFDRIQPGSAYITHMCHDFSHRQWCARLPAGVRPAYDGLELEAGEELK